VLPAIKLFLQMKKLITFIIVILFFSIHLFAQTVPPAPEENSHAIAGIVQDRSSSQPVEFTTVQLLNGTDSTIIKTTVTDRKGKFVLEKIASGNYILRCSFIGYEKIIMPVTVNQKRENVGVIQMGILSKNMSEVTVTSRKSLLNTAIDRKIYNVTQDIMAQSGSASDILKNIPSVEVDIEGVVSLRGSTDVMILINGRPSPLMGKSRADVLQQLPANSIERIEVITNPSARYKPDGTSGIINIVLKKDTKGGWNGSVVANAGNNDRYNGGVTLNYKPGKLNIFGNYNIRKDKRIRLNTINREYLDSTGKTDSYYDEDGQSPARPLSHIATLGADYTLNEHNTVGISGNYHYRKQVKHDVVKKFFYDKDHLLTSKYNRLRYDPEFEKEKDATAYWQHNFPKEDHELRIEFNASASDEVEDNHYTNVYYFPVLPSSFDNTLIQQGDHQQQLTIDYSNPLSEDSKLELGYDGSFNQIDMIFYGEYYDTAQRKFIKDAIKSNRFKYHDAIHAIYGTYQHSFGLFGYSAGLRLEQTLIKGNLVTKDSLISNDYFKIYPTLHLSYKLKKGELQMNYSKRVHRPEGDDLNPFPEYQDPYNLRAGNPKLLPEIIHSIEFGYKWQNEKFSFVPSLYYRYKQNGFTSVIMPLNDSVLLTTQQNLSNDKSTGLELIFSARAGKFLTANLSANFFYNQIDASSLGYTSKKSIVSMSTNFNSTAVLTKTTMLQLNCNYRSARLTPQGKVFGSFVLNAGMRQDLFKKKVSVILTASDLLNTLKQKTELNTPYLKQVAIGRRDARIIYLGISYRFGKVIKKSNEEKLQFDNNL
jgi:outer membrane receptor protein involved in Fe transport